MPREIDRRDPAINLTTPARTNSLNERASEISRSLSGAHVLSIDAFDAPTGNPSLVTSAGAPAETGNWVQRALNHVQEISPILGLEETQAPEFIADPTVQFSSSGSATVHLQQQYKGIRIFQTAQGVRFNPDGSIADTVGKSVTIQQDLQVAPKLTVQDAVLKAAQYVAEPGAVEEDVDQFGQAIPATPVALDNFTPKIIATFPNQPESPTVLEAGPFGHEIKANLMWFPLSNQPRLAWEVVLVMPAQGGQYRVFVDADNGEILYCRQLMSSVVAEGNVYVVDGANGRQVVRFPRPLTDYNVPLPEGLPEGFPDHWVASNSASGNAVNAFSAATGQTFTGAMQNGVLSLNPDDPSGEDQQVLNIFYLNCVIHDFLYLYGFRESDGNFQQDNFGRGGTVADPVTAYAHAGPVNGTANMSTRIDGVSPVMNMGLYEPTGRHTAFDSTVVFHEFMHGVTHRLVGGPLNTQALEDYQSAGMGEGWGDYIACTINNTNVVGAWLKNNTGGIRKYPYDSNYPDHFGMLGTGRYNRPELNKQHAVGEIWCATLLEMNRRIGSHLGVQLVIDALKLSPVRPSFRDMRDSILKALDNKLLAHQLTEAEHATNRAGIWAAFARFGMGPNAQTNGASLTGVVADFNVPSAPAPMNEEPPVIGMNATLGLADDDLKDEQTREAFDDVLAAIRIHGEELVNIPNVVRVQPGYRFRGATFVPEPVLSITVLRKLPNVPPGELIPTHLGKVPVDVVPATPREQLAFIRRRQQIASADSQVPAGEISTVVPGEVVVNAEDESAASPLAPYVPPAKSLALVDEEMTVICHASPDAGWRNLRQFISETQQSLTSTMYEFNARHILDALTTTMQEPRQMHLILDGGKLNEVLGPSSTTISKLAARQTLANSLHERFECVWAPVRDDDLTTVSFFPWAYHTKVTVRDGGSFWLSSGNWKESSQPRIDPINGPLPPGFDKDIFQGAHNRDWHVIINNRSLAETFQTYITHDITQATPIQKPAPAPPLDEEMPDLFIPEAGLSAFAAFDSEPQFYLEQRFTKKIKVQPLMTPDNFPEMVRPLIEGAQRSLYFQNQTLSPAPWNDRYTPLFNALRDKTKQAPNLDVKLLVSEYTETQPLIESDFNMSCVKTQLQCHNKGIIIDDEIVIVGSHNWSGAGCTQNRDASLIFYDAEIAAYFKKLFLYDWNRIGVSNSLMLSMPIVAMPGEDPPPGMKRVPWSAVFPEWREACEAGESIKPGA